QASSAFQAVDHEVQAEILSQLKAGRTHVRLSAAQLPTVAFESTTSDLYWGFRGTQGLTVTGSGHRAHGRYTGTLRYVIRDSYGIPAGDTLDGFGPPMRYLQTACGAPQHRGGARWFPDTITVTVPFNRSALSGRRLPESVQREGSEAVPERQGLLSGVEHVAGHQPRAHPAGEVTEPGQVLGPDCCPRFHLDGDHAAVGGLQDSVYLDLVLGAVVVQPSALGAPGQL